MRTCSALCGSTCGNCLPGYRRGTRLSKSRSGPGYGEPAELVMKDTESCWQGRAIGQPFLGSNVIGSIQRLCVNLE